MAVYQFSEYQEDNRTFKEKVRAKCQDAKVWFYRNRETIITLAPMVIAGVTTVTKVVGKRVNLHKEKTLKEHYCYDRSLGHYWALRRDLSNNEWLEVDRRKKNGERLADILGSMKVLK